MFRAEMQGLKLEGSNPNEMMPTRLSHHPHCIRRRENTLDFLNFLLCCLRSRRDKETENEVISGIYDASRTVVQAAKNGNRMFELGFCYLALLTKRQGEAVNI